MNHSADEELFRAHDAYSSAILLSLLVLAGQIIAIATRGMAPQGIPLALDYALAAVASVALGYLVATRHRPRERAAWAACATLLLSYFVLTPWAAARWGHLGRPWEAFQMPQLAMVSVALTVPGSLWLGTAAVLAFVLESLVIYDYFVAVGTPANWLPITQPTMMFTFAAVGAAAVVARRRRRALVLQYIHSQAEAATLKRLSSLFRELTDELRIQLAVLSEGLAGSAAAGSLSLERGRGAIARLTGLRERLLVLLGQPTAEDATMASREEPTAARPTSIRRRFRSPGAWPMLRLVGDDASPAMSEAERHLYASDAYQVARAVAVAIMVAMIFNDVVLRHSSFIHLLYGAEALLAAICLAILQQTRARPSEKRGILLYLVIVVPLLFIHVYAQKQLAHGTGAFEPLITTKVLVVVLALAAPRLRWLNRTLVLLVALEGIVLFYTLHFDDMRDRIPITEPWPLLNYLLIAVALLLLREQRRVASVRLLRADREMAALARQADVVLALLDQFGSPLQILTVSTAILFRQQPDHPERERLESALQTISSLRGRMPQIDHRTYDRVGVSLDAASVLRRQ
jgi:hypothetical protein